MQAHYDTVDFAHSFNCSLLTASELSSNSNVNVNGRWGFHVYDGNVIYFHRYYFSISLNMVTAHIIYILILC